MSTLSITEHVDPGTRTVVIRSLVVTLALATAAIHASLGGLLFLANAIGYSTLAVAMIMPGPVGHIRWLVRLMLIGFTAATIGGWVLFGSRFPLAYLDKGIEVGLVAVVAIELWRSDGGPIGVARKARRLLSNLARTQTAKVPR